jgi:hypothetical protein
LGAAGSVVVVVMMVVVVVWALLSFACTIAFLAPGVGMWAGGSPVRPANGGRGF